MIGYSIGGYVDLNARMEQYGIRQLIQPGPPSVTRLARKPFALDNGAYACYVKGTQFNFDAFEALLDQHGAEGPDFVVLPDIVGAGLESLAFSIDWAEHRGHRFAGLPFYLVLQDGMRARDIDPYIASIEGLFLGGTTPWKHKKGHYWGDYAQREGKPLHIGRCTSNWGIRWAMECGATSVDGNGPAWSREGLERYALALAGAPQRKSKATGHKPGQKGVVGGRDPIDILDDPTATDAELRDLYAIPSNQLALLAHPNCPPDLWWDAARDFPVEAMRSPLYPLLTLANPDRWASMEQELAPAWLNAYTQPYLRAQAPSETDLRFFAATCIEHVLPFFLAQYPNDTSVQKAIEAARAYAYDPEAGRATSWESSSAMEEVKTRAREEYQRRWYSEEAQQALVIEDVARGASYINAQRIDGALGNALNAGCEAAGHAAAARALAVRGWGEEPREVANEAYNKGSRQEALWQWRYLLSNYLRGSEQVGAKWPQARWPTDAELNPQAKPDEIVALAKTVPLVALAHPQCPTELWWELAAKHPIEAERSVLFPLLTLENPGRWEGMTRENIEHWIRQYMRTLPPRERRLFAADCAERVLPIFEEANPGDLRPRQSIEMARDWATGGGWTPDRLRVEKAALSAAFSNQPSYVARAAANALSGHEEEVRNVPSLAAMAMGSRYPSPSYGAAVQNEFLWQWHRLRQYLQGDVVGAYLTSLPHRKGGHFDLYQNSSIREVLRDINPTGQVRGLLVGPDVILWNAETEVHRRVAQQLTSLDLPATSMLAKLPLMLQYRPGEVDIEVDLEGHARRTMAQLVEFLSNHPYFAGLLAKGTKIRLRTDEGPSIWAALGNPGESVGAYLTSLEAYGRYFDVWQNPTYTEISKELHEHIGRARGLIVGPDVFLWPAAAALHEEVSKALTRTRHEAKRHIIVYFKGGIVSVIWEDRHLPIEEAPELLRSHPYFKKLMKRYPVRLRTGEEEGDWLDLGNRPSKVGAYLTTLPHRYEGHFDLYKNSSPREVLKGISPEGHARCILVGPDAYLWNAGAATHEEVESKYNFGPDIPIEMLLDFHPGRVDIRMISGEPVLRGTLRLLQRHPYFAGLRAKNRIRISHDWDEAHFDDLYPEGE